MSTHHSDKVFSGSIPELYDTLLVPLIFEPYARDLARRVADEPVSRVLEIAAGTGVVTRAVVDALDPNVSIVATDLNQPMLDHGASVRADGNVDWRQADALALPFEDATFDAVVCQFGVMFFPDRARAYSEALRVLKRGGQLYVSSKNRYALLHFLGGAPDHVSKRPWIGMLSPRLQTLLTLGRMEDSRARIHTLGGFRRLFEHTGFSERAVYALMPDFRCPKRIVPLNTQSPAGFKGPSTRGFYSRRLERALASLLPPALLKHLVHCYGFLLEKP